MAKLPQVSGKELVRIFKKDGWIEVSQRGSHLKLVKGGFPCLQGLALRSYYSTVFR